MVLRAGARYELRVFGAAIDALDPAARLALAWPRWYPPTAQDASADTQSLVALVGAGLLSRETAVRSLAERFAIDDIAAEVARLDAADFSAARDESAATDDPDDPDESGSD
jgi:hypothetical protein